MGGEYIIKGKIFQGTYIVIGFNTAARRRAGKKKSPKLQDGLGPGFRFCVFCRRSRNTRQDGYSRLAVYDSKESKAMVVVASFIPISFFEIYVLLLSLLIYT
jgi:hypothetical protein